MVGVVGVRCLHVPVLHLSYPVGEGENDNDDDDERDGKDGSHISVGYALWLHRRRGCVDIDIPPGF